MSNNEAFRKDFAATMAEYETNILYTVYGHSKEFNVPFDVLIMGLANGLINDLKDREILDELERNYTQGHKNGGADTSEA